MALAAGSVVAQKLPPPSRTVYKCEQGGQVHYSDSPCLGAEKLEIEPTRGLNKSSGREQVGADVRREREREVVAEAIRPLVGQDARQLDRAGRRMKLRPDVQRACGRLDLDIPAAEQRRPAAKDAERQALERRLLEMRQRFRELGCD